MTITSKRILCVGKIVAGPIEWDISPLPVVAPTLLVSRYMNKAGFLDMQSNYFLDGQHAAREGQPLAAMPTEYHEQGWWSAQRTQGERDRFDGSIDDDEQWIREGC